MEKIEHYLTNISIEEVKNINMVLDYESGQTYYELSCLKNGKKVPESISVMISYYDSLILVKKVKEIVKNRSKLDLNYENKIFPEHV